MSFKYERTPRNKWYDECYTHWVFYIEETKRTARFMEENRESGQDGNSFLYNDDDESTLQYLRDRCNVSFEDFTRSMNEEDVASHVIRKYRK